MVILPGGMNQGNGELGLHRRLIEAGKSLASVGGLELGGGNPLAALILLQIRRTVQTHYLVGHRSLESDMQSHFSALW